MYRGRLQLGDEVTLTCLCVNGSGVPSAPDAAPKIDVYAGAVKVVSGKAIPALDRYGTTGLFAFNLLLGTQFATGRYSVTYRYTNGAFADLQADVFDIIAGGQPDGDIISMHWLPLPHANFLVYQTDSGKLRKVRNPYL